MPIQIKPLQWIENNPRYDLKYYRADSPSGWFIIEDQGKNLGVSLKRYWLTMQILQTRLYPFDNLTDAMSFAQNYFHDNIRTWLVEFNEG